MVLPASLLGGSVAGTAEMDAFDCSVELVPQPGVALCLWPDWQPKANSANARTVHSMDFIGAYRGPSFWPQAGPTGRLPNDNAGLLSESPTVSNQANRRYSRAACNLTGSGALVTLA